MGQQETLLRFGQRVRVMQTKEMVAEGLANCHGTVMSSQCAFLDLVTVAIDDDPNGYYDRRNKMNIKIPSYSLMRISCEAIRSTGEE